MLRTGDGRETWSEDSISGRRAVREDESSSALVETFSLYEVGHFLMEAYAYWNQLDRNAVMQLLHQKLKKNPKKTV